MTTDLVGAMQDLADRWKSEPMDVRNPDVTLVKLKCATEVMDVLIDYYRACLLEFGK